MKYEAEVYGSLCSLSKFEINGVSADSSDFVNQYDADSHNAEDYCCGDMVADVLQPTEIVLAKYGITVEEYDVIAEDVSSKLSFGSCGWCE